LYHDFSRIEKFGNPELLKQARECALEYLENPKTPASSNMSSKVFSFFYGTGWLSGCESRGKVNGLAILNYFYKKWNV